MIGRVKKWLGIEGVKLELLLPEQVEAQSGVLRGRIRLQSLKPQTVYGIRIALIERYSRGRGEERLVDEYELGRTELEHQLEVLPGETRELPFELAFQTVQSNIENFGKKNLLYKGLATIAQKANAVQSEYRVEAEARVQGVALNPFDKKTLTLK